MILTLAWL